MICRLVITVFAAFCTLSSVLAAGPQFELGATSNRVTCVIDGDTFRWRGEKVRIEDLDAPELHSARARPSMPSRYAPPNV